MTERNIFHTNLIAVKKRSYKNWHDGNRHQKYQNNVITVVTWVSTAAMTLAAAKNASSIESPVTSTP